MYLLQVTKDRTPKSIWILRFEEKYELPHNDCHIYICKSLQKCDVKAQYYAIEHYFRVLYDKIIMTILVRSSMAQNG